MGDEGFCREQAAAESLAGTAKGPVRRWVLVEDGLPWKAKLPRDSLLPADVRERLAQIDADPHTRVQLIRRPCQGQGDERQVFVVESSQIPTERRLAHTRLKLAQLASLDPSALSERADPCDEQAALWLVCTHGTRDRCCAKWGMALWESLSRIEGERVWQCSHLGGHRFAPTFTVLPSGLTYGRFESSELDALSKALAAGQVGALDRLRGRNVYPPAAQRAEIELREQGGWREDGQLRLVDYAPLEGGEFELSFETPEGLARVRVSARASTLATPSECGAEPSPRKLYTLRRVS